MLRGMDGSPRFERRDLAPDILVALEKAVQHLESFRTMPPAISENEERIRTEELQKAKDEVDEAIATAMATIETMEDDETRDALIARISALRDRSLEL